MSRPPVFPAEDRVRIVLSVLAGEMTIAEAARRNKVFETSIGKWRQQFLEAGRLGLAAGGRRAQLGAGALAGQAALWPAILPAHRDVVAAHAAGGDLHQHVPRARRGCGNVR